MCTSLEGFKPVKALFLQRVRLNHFRAPASCRFRNGYKRSQTVPHASSLGFNPTLSANSFIFFRLQSTVAVNLQFSGMKQGILNRVARRDGPPTDDMSLVGVCDKMTKRPRRDAD